jgi:hypothetical protein
MMYHFVNDIIKKMLQILNTCDFCQKPPRIRENLEIYRAIALKSKYELNMNAAATEWECFFSSFVFACRNASARLLLNLSSHKTHATAGNVALR